MKTKVCIECIHTYKLVVILEDSWNFTLDLRFRQFRLTRQ